jgi:hypothetical protein
MKRLAFGGSDSGRRRRKLLALAAWGVLGAGSLIVKGDVTATWISTFGPWTTPTDWSTNPAYPNNGNPTGVNYEAIFNSSFVLPNTVILSTNVTLDSLVLDAGWLTLAQTTGSLQVGTLEIDTGKYNMTASAATLVASTLNLNGGSLSVSGTLSNSAIDLAGGSMTVAGTLSNSTINFNGGSLSLSKATLNGIQGTGGAVPSNVAIAGTTTVENGLTFANGTLTLAPPDPSLFTPTNMVFDGPSQTIDDLTIYNNHLPS